MGIVELDGKVFVKVFQPGQKAQADPDHVPERTGDEEILLFQAKLLALDGFIVGVEDLGDVFRKDLGIDGTVIVAHIEGGEFKGRHRLSPPQPQQVAGVHPVADNGGIVGNPSHSAVGNPAYAVAAVLVGERFGMTSKTHLKGEFRAADFPRVAQAQPLVRLFALPAVANHLIEDSEFIANAVTHSGNLESCQGIEIAGCQSPKSPIAQPRFVLLVEQGLNVKTNSRAAGAHLLIDAQVDQVVLQMRAEQEFRREVGNYSGIFVMQLPNGLEPPVQQLIAHGVSQRQVELVLRSILRVLAQGVEEMLVKGTIQAFQTDV